MAKSEANSKPVLAAEDIYIITVYVYKFLTTSSILAYIFIVHIADYWIFFHNHSYGRIYCLQVDRVAMLLHSYRLYRDAVIQQVGFAQIC